MPHPSETRIQRGLGKIQSLAHAFANVTPEGHARKVQESQWLAVETIIAGRKTAYAALDEKSVSETMKFSAGIGGVITSGALGLNMYTSSF